MIGIDDPAYIGLLNIIEQEKEFSSILTRFGLFLADSILHNPKITLTILNFNKAHDRISVKYKFIEGRVYGHPETEQAKGDRLPDIDESKIGNIPTMLDSKNYAYPIVIKGKLSGYFILSSPTEKNFEKKTDLLPSLFYILKNEYYIYNILKLVIKDELTGLYNKRCLIDRLSKRYATEKEKNASFAIAIIDIDRFKHYNDSYGHQVGDHILRKVSALLLNWCREIGYEAFRYGGEEIFLLFNGKNAAESLRAMESVRQKIMEANFSTDEWFLKLTVSAGIADNSTNTAFLELIEQADKALYYSKKNGRNKSTQYTQEICP